MPIGYSVNADLLAMVAAEAPMEAMQRSVGRPSAS
jgi:hypothetical protein